MKYDNLSLFFISNFINPIPFQRISNFHTFAFTLEAQYIEKRSCPSSRSAIKTNCQILEIYRVSPC